MRSSRSRLSVQGVVLAISACCSAQGWPAAGLAAEVPAVAVGTEVSSPASSQDADLDDFSRAVGQQRVSVVSIAAVRPAGGNQSDVRSPEGDSDVDPTTDRPFPPTATRVRGCGILLSEDGYVLTNSHVVGGASMIDVTRVSGEKYRARLVGIDHASDIAVLKIEGRNLPAARLGNPGALRPGQWVAAIGSPFGLEQSVAVGVVSAVQRVLPDDESYTPFIQTDLPLNPGDSGGPLFDEAGAVVGLNTEVVFTDGAFVGISFSIPIDVAVNIATQLIRTGYIDRPELGIRVQDINPQLSRAFGAPAGGVLVHTVVADGPGQYAGLRVGDIILELQGKRIDSARQFTAALAPLVPGTPASLRIWRERACSDVLVRTRHSAIARALGPSEADPAIEPAIATRVLSPRRRHELGTEGKLLVVSVSERAAAAGVFPGDILLAVNDKPLQSLSELFRAFAGAPSVALLVERDGERLFVAVPTGGWTPPTLEVPGPEHSARR